MEEKENYFFAINIPDESADSLRLVQAHLPKRVRYTLTNYFHVTLKFLGELNDLEVMTARLKAREVSQKMLFQKKDLFVQFSKVGAFFKSDKPAVIWAGVYLPKAIFDFQRNLDEGLNQVGFPMEKRHFRPHITLARVREIDGELFGVNDDLNQLGVQKKQLAIESFYLMKSHLAPHRSPQYEVIEEYKLNF